ncbi:uncharacterized protein LOC115621451 [Scaptodrosophila lebanonensis]|uniref:Uncharacterized protein LOC115621451 n=1 Tax=Drosophila lebanonensis TaxID=7225 RepID=A0A6J2T4M1_DROLE|nr:uncharacterized protein LOC115621451 [Scaptodrosophila lebanonensis]
MAQNVTNVELKLNIEVLTPGNIAECVNSILEFLLYQRRQIPFVYRTYKFIIDRWAQQECDAKPGLESFSDYQLHQQRSKATETKNAISDMREFIRDVFKSYAVRSLRFLFGSNAFMPKEAYTIHIPTTMTRKHNCEHHATSNSMSQTLLSLLTCEDLYTIFSTEMNATNLFLELEIFSQEQDHGSSIETIKLFPKDVMSQLPRSCKHIHLHLLHDSNIDASAMQCCKELRIFEDLEILGLGDETENTVVGSECNKKTEQDSGWWQADVTVRGFRTSLQDLWSS